MAQIPLGNFGQVTPQLEQNHVIDTGGALIGEAVTDLGKAVGTYEVKVKKEQDKQDTFELTRQAAEFSVKSSDIAAEMQNRLANGDVDVPTAQQASKDLYDQLQSDYSARVPQSKQLNFNEYAVKDIANNVSKIVPIAIQAQNKQNLQAVQELSDNTLKTPDRDQALATLVTGLKASNTPLVAQQKTVADWQQSRDSTDVEKQFIGSRLDNTMLTTLRSTVEADKQYAHLTPDAKNAALIKIDLQMDRNNRADQAARDQKDQEAKQGLKDLQAAVATGEPLSDKLIGDARKLTAGSVYAAQAEDAIAASGTLQKIRPQPISIQEQGIANAKAKVNSTGQDDPVTNEQRIALQEKSLNRSKDLAINNAAARYQERTGILLPSNTITTQNILTGEAGIVSKMTQSIALLAQQKKVDGVGSLNPLPPTQRSEIVDAYTKGNGTQRAVVLANLYNMFAPSGGDALNEAFSMLSKDNIDAHVLAATAMIATHPTELKIRGTNTKIADVVATGIMLHDLGQDKELLPQELDGIKNATFNQVVGASSSGGSGGSAAGLIGSTEYLVHRTLADRAYTAMAQKQKNSLDTVKGTVHFDSELYTKAINITSGEPYAQPNGNKVFLDYGVSPARAERQIHDQLQYYAVTTNTSFPQLKDSSLEPVPGQPTSFYLRGAGTKALDYFKDPKTKQNLIITIRQ